MPKPRRKKRPPKRVLEPRLVFNRTVAMRYRIHLEQKLYAPTTINLRQAADSGLLSPELAAGIRRVEGAVIDCLAELLLAPEVARGRMGIELEPNR